MQWYYSGETLKLKDLQKFYKGLILKIEIMKKLEGQIGPRSGRNY